MIYVSWINFVLEISNIFLLGLLSLFSLSCTISRISFVQFGVLLISELSSSAEMANGFCSCKIKAVRSGIKAGGDPVKNLIFFLPLR